MAFIVSGLPLRSATPIRAVSKCSADNYMKVASAVAAATAGALLAASIRTTLPADASVFNFRGERPTSIGLRSERYFAGCPPTPNCISSMENVYDEHYVPAWSYAEGNGGKEMKEAVSDVLDVLDKYEGESVNIIEKRDTKSDIGVGYYILAEFQSPFWGFVDDVEFFWQPDGKTVEYRSASRLGEGDLGANRKRIRSIRKSLEEKGGWASQGYN